MIIIQLTFYYIIQQNNMSKQIEDQKPIQVNQASNTNQQKQNFQSVLHKIDAPPTNFNLPQNALEYDIKLGWIPRSQITGPIPLSFNSYINDEVIETKMKSMIYLGYRPQHTFELHERYYEKGKKYPFYQFHLCKSQFLERFFKKYYSQYQFNGSRKAQIIGESALQFDSDFEGGNLDAVYFEENEYRLLLRVDSNTQGHCHYYNFRVRVNTPGKYTLRIMNINKQKSLYQRGMRPYVRYRKDGKWSQFKQCDSKVSFGDSLLCEQFDIKVKLKSFNFQFQFTSQVQQYEFCYSIPSNYSNLLQFLNGLRNSPFMHFTKLCHTLSGVEIPLLTITSKDRQIQQQKQHQKQPFVVVITGRVHPSETNSSHIINGLISSLLGNSESAKYLRKNVIFKIIPMLNPDGVIIGNARTSFAGKDLNRKYYKNTQFVYPEIIGVMDYVLKLKSKYQNKLLYLIDVHGHSARKNSFFYGPEYSIIDLQYTKCRLLPKIFSQKTDVFRYYSCKYKLVSSKQYTARGYFNSSGIRAYTHQTSIHCHWNFQKRMDQPFTRKTLEKLGQSMVESIADYVRMQTIPSKQLKQQIQKDIQTTNVRRKGVDFQQDQQNSQEMASSKDDSQSDGEDLQDKKLQQFYNRINQNKEYFIQELEAMQKQSPDKKDKDKDKEKIKNQERKRKKSESLMKTQTNYQNQKISQKREKIEDEIILKKNVQKVDWAAKVTYPQRKKSYQQYTKMSSVIFGSSIPPSYFMSNQYKASVSSNNSLTNFNQTKYTIKYLDAQFKSTNIKYPSPQPKVYKTKQLKRQVSLGQQVARSKQLQKQKSVQKVIERITLQKFMQLKKQSDIQNEIASHPRLVSKSQMERLLSKPSEYCLVKPIPVCSVQLQTQKQQQEKLIKKINGSLKVLTRKKSIKSIRQSQKSLPKRQNQGLRQSLTKKLPSIRTLMNKF